MISIDDVIQAFEKRVPLHLAESWDNSGLQLGNPSQELTGIITTLDITDEAVNLAIDKRVNFIIAHHPMIFSPLKKIDERTAEGALIAKLLRHQLTVYAAHTNYDVVEGGLNDLMAEKLELQNIQNLIPTGISKWMKMVVFVPPAHGDVVRKVLQEMGAGMLGEYEGCSYTTVGTGRFIPSAAAKPYIGTIGELEKVEEERIEVILPENLAKEAFSAVQRVHPYEEPAMEMYELTNPQQVHSLGRIGRLPRALLEKEFMKYIVSVFPGSTVRFGGAHQVGIRKVAICTGSGAEFMEAAKKMGADAYVTGDLKYHDMQRAKGLGLLVADAGHFGTEEIAASGLARIVEGVLEEMDVSSDRIFVNEQQQDFFFL